MHHQVIINANSIIERIIINSKSLIEHDVEVEWCHISTNSTINGNYKN